jgi:hypothetical protein
MAAASMCFGSAMTAPELLAPLRQAQLAAAANRDRRPEAHDAAMTTVAPGNQWPWGEELALLWSALHHESAALLDSVVAKGFWEPILMGDDSRLWGGHRRLAVAPEVGISVPVELGGEEARR